MSRLSYRRKKSLRASAFVFPKGTKRRPGKKMFPIIDKRHARAALSRATQRKVGLTPRERCAVVRKVCSRVPSLGVCHGETTSKKLASCRR